MPEGRTSRVPSYRHHKPSGQAVLTLGGKAHHLGKWKSKANRRRYEQLISEYLANGLSLLTEVRSDLTIVELIAAYMGLVKTYCTKNSRPTNDVEAIDRRFGP